MSGINIYDPRLLVAALNQIAVPKRFILSNFFKTVVPFETEKVDIDIKKGNRNVAVFVHPLENGHLVEDGGYETMTVAPAYTKELKSITPTDTVKRMFGEDWTNPLSPRQREQRLLGEKLIDLETRVIRVEEVMAAQALVHGAVVVKGKKMDHKVSFGYELGKHKIVLSGSKCWDQTGSDPMFDLDDWSDKISERSGLAPNMIICGKKALRAIIDNEKVQKRLDIRNYHVGVVDISVNQELADQGVIYHGMLAPSNVPIYTYNEKYFNETTKTVEPLIPDNVVLMGSTSAGCQMLYGLIQNINALTSLPRFPWSWTENNGSARYIQLESAPLPNLYQVDAFVSATVL